MRVQMIDMGLGNIGSVCRMMQRVGIEPQVIRSRQELSADHAVILPGVGHFSHASQFLDSSDLRGPLSDLMGSGHPILGICLGAQLFCKESEEGAGVGLGWVSSSVRRFPAQQVGGGTLRVPHMGWRRFAPPDGTLPFHVPPGRMYYAHSYFIDPLPDAGSVVCTSTVGGHEFASVVRIGNSLGFQFHPEKSHLFGCALVSAWVAWASALCMEAPDALP
jgi:glutamine amidotransferase